MLNWSSGGLLMAQTVFSEPESLGGASDLGVWLFERPLLVGGALAVLGLLVVWRALQRASKRVGIVGASFLALAVGAYLLGQFVTTDRERISTGTRELVEAVVGDDRARVDEILSERLSVLMAGTRLEGVGKQEILGSFTALQRYGVRDGDVGRLEASMEGRDVGLTQARVRVEVSSTPSLSWWRFDWRRESDGQWRVFRLHCLLINGREPQWSVLPI
ncbi:MAG: hypothetical protein ACF8GE_07355 [Phycisphaerales bacterium JB043]